MKTKIFWAFLTICLLGMNNSIAQTFDQIIIGNNNGQTFVIPDLPDDAEYRIGIENGGLFPIQLANYIPGSVFWGTLCDDGKVDVLTPHCGSGRYYISYKKNDNIWYNLDMYIHYFISTESSILEASSGSWTAIADDWLDEKTLQLPSGVNSLTMNVVNEVAGNFLEFIWYFEKEDLSLHEIAIIQNNEPVNINLNNKDQIKIIIKAYDSSSSGYDSEDYFIIKSAGPKIYNLSGSSYCEGSTGIVTLSSSESGVSYQLFQNETPTQAPQNGNGTALTWSGILAGSYTVVATKSGMTATMDGIAEVVENPLPKNPAIRGDRLVERGETVLYTASAEHAGSYSWAIAPAGGATLSPSGVNASIAFPHAGGLTITLQATNDCGSTPASHAVQVLDMEHINGLESRISAIAQELNVSAEGTAIEQEIATLGTTITGLQSRIGAIAQELNVGTEGTAIEQEIATLGETITGLQGRISAIAQGLNVSAEGTAIEQEIATLGETITGLQSRISAIAQQLNVGTAGTEVESRIGELLVAYVLKFEGNTTHTEETAVGTFQFSIYPNPTPGEVHITSTEPISEVRVYNSGGTSFQRQAVNSTHTSFIVHRSHVAGSIFFVEITLANGSTYTQKMVLAQ